LREFLWSSLISDLGQRQFSEHEALEVLAFCAYFRKGTTKIVRRLSRTGVDIAHGPNEVVVTTRGLADAFCWPSHERVRRFLRDAQARGWLTFQAYRQGRNSFTIVRPDVTLAGPSSSEDGVPFPEPLNRPSNKEDRKVASHLLSHSGAISRAIKPRTNKGESADGVPFRVTPTLRSKTEGGHISEGWDGDDREKQLREKNSRRPARFDRDERLRALGWAER
jgi:hypothetical protein